ncbi:MAG TPA: F0F1 ATP synthase subunit delta [Candidatus Saccharimonadales bacterium]|nr:F0F1 ATP synthase subunit delta [Candidatus Saccharimonadales bacterium]
MSSKISRSELVVILDKLSTKLPSKKFSREVANYLLSEKRTGELDSLARELINYRAEKGVVEVTAVSARALSSTAVSEVKQKVKQLYPGARQIIINQRIDDSQIGGVRLEFPDKQLDLTLRSKINKFKQQTVGN